jgi:hypothetical protein
VGVLLVLCGEEVADERVNGLGECLGGLGLVGPAGLVEALLQVACEADVQVYVRSVAA